MSNETQEVCLINDKNSSMLCIGVKKLVIARLDRAIQIQWIPRSSRRMTNYEFMDRHYI
jgi:hypothetical protein